MRRLLTLALAGALLSLVPTIDVATAGTNVYVVDDDGAQCGNADFTTIGAAVAKANAGDRVRICPGTYAERVMVDKPLTLQGRPDDVAALPCFAAPENQQDDLDTTVVPVLQPPDTVGAPVLRIAADDVEVAGLVVQGVHDVPEQVDGFDIYEPALTVDDGHVGWRVRHNLFRLNTFAVEPGGSGRVDHNCFRDNSYAAANQRHYLTDTRIDHNATYRTGVATWEIGWGYRPTFRMTLDHNVSLRDARPFYIENSHVVAVVGNKVESATNFGMQVRQGTESVLVQGNTVTGTTAGPAVTLPAPAAGQPSATDVTIRGNNLSHNLLSALTTMPNAAPLALVVEANTASDNGVSGIVLAPATRNALVTGNVAERNVNFGFRAAGSTRDNVFNANIALGNGLSDTRDESGVPVLNTWRATTCDTDFPVGTIC